MTLDFSDIDILFHGSRKRFSKISPHKGRNPKGDSNSNRYAVYATPYFLIAVAYAMSVTRTSLFKPKVKIITYSEGKVRVILDHCYLTPKAGYVYIIPARGFYKNNFCEYWTCKEVNFSDCIYVSFERMEELMRNGDIDIIEQAEPPKYKIHLCILRAFEIFITVLSFVKNTFFYRMKC